MSCSSTRNLWSTLPAELRILILQSMPDLPTLRNILLVRPLEIDLYRNYHRDIFDLVIDRSFCPEIRSIVNKIRDHLIFYSAPLDKRCEYWCAGRTDPRSIEEYHPVGHVAVLFKLAEMAKSIEDFTQAFAEKRVLIPSGRPNDQVSPTELHRIRRAFWRFQFFYRTRTEEDDDNGSEDEIEKVKGGKRYLSEIVGDAPDAGEQWLRRRPGSASTGLIKPSSELGSLKWWEVREFDAIRGFLREEVNRIQFNRYQTAGESSTSPEGLLREQPVLLQKIIEQVEHWPAILPDNMKDHPLIAHVEWRIDHGPTNDDRWPESPRGANAAPVGRGEAHFLDSQQSLAGSHSSWGLCMWERDRLIQTELLFPDTYFVPLYPIQLRKGDIKALKDAHRHCAMVVETVFDSSIEALHDAAVARATRMRLQANKMKQSKGLLNWVKDRDSVFFEEWNKLLTEGDFEKEAQKQEEMCDLRAQLMKNIKKSRSDEESSSEEADLELFISYRTYSIAHVRLHRD